jgi:hypothetical protein
MITSNGQSHHAMRARRSAMGRGKRLRISRTGMSTTMV